MNIKELEPFAAGYIGAEGKDIEMKIACGMLKRAKHMPIKLDGGMFASFFDKRECVGVRYLFGEGIQVSRYNIDREKKEYPELEAELENIYNTMLPFNTNSLIQNSKSEYENKLCDMRVCWGGDWGGHSNPDFGRLLHLGTDGIRKKAEKFRQNGEKTTFYDSLLLVLDAVDIMGSRCREMAFEAAKTAAPDDKTRLLRIAAAFENIPQNKPRNFFEACQMFWMIFGFDGIDSPGRFDMYMYEFYAMSPKEEREHCLCELWQLFYATRTWNLCISGSNADGSDCTNELSYDILELAQKYKYNTPNLTMRVHKNTPLALWKSAAKTIATGIGMPAIYNDECVCGALEALGIPPEDSHGYCMNGCNQIDIFGKSHMGLEDGEVCLAKCLELTLYNGKCGVSGDMLGIRSGDCKGFETYDELFCAYKRQVEYITDRATEMSNRAQRIFAENAPNPYRSLLIDGCIEKGRDYKNGGPVYCHGQILAEGIADTADSLAAIKHFVFDVKKYKMSEVTDALKADFIGFDELYYDFSGYHKFGNDYEDVDEICAAVAAHFNNYLLTKRTWRGGNYGGGCSPYNRAALYGAKIGALPSGKRKESSLLADSIGAVPGKDTNGPTALLNSVLHYNQQLAKSGNVLNLKFNKSIFSSQKGLNAFISLSKAYFYNGGQQLSVTVVSVEELIEAKKNPERYGSLIVRVGGYSDYFTRLSPELQDNIIRRTAISV